MTRQLSISERAALQTSKGGEDEGGCCKRSILLVMMVPFIIFTFAFIGICAWGLWEWERVDRNIYLPPIPPSPNRTQRVAAFTQRVRDFMATDYGRLSITTVQVNGTQCATTTRALPYVGYTADLPVASSFPVACSVPLAASASVTDARASSQQRRAHIASDDGDYPAVAGLLRAAGDTAVDGKNSSSNNSSGSTLVVATPTSATSTAVTTDVASTTTTSTNTSSSGAGLTDATSTQSPAASETTSGVTSALPGTQSAASRTRIATSTSTTQVTQTLGTSAPAVTSTPPAATNTPPSPPPPSVPDGTIFQTFPIVVSDSVASGLLVMVVSAAGVPTETTEVNLTCSPMRCTNVYGDDSGLCYCTAAAMEAICTKDYAGSYRPRLSFDDAQNITECLQFADCGSCVYVRRLTDACVPLNWTDTNGWVRDPGTPSCFPPSVAETKFGPSTAAAAETTVFVAMMSDKDPYIALMAATNGTGNFDFDSVRPLADTQTRADASAAARLKMIIAAACSSVFASIVCYLIIEYMHAGPQRAAGSSYDFSHLGEAEEVDDEIEGDAALAVAMAPVGSKQKAATGGGDDALDDDLLIGGASAPGSQRQNAAADMDMLFGDGDGTNDVFTPKHSFAAGAYSITSPTMRSLGTPAAPSGGGGAVSLSFAGVDPADLEADLLGPPPPAPSDGLDDDTALGML